VNERKDFTILHTQQMEQEKETAKEDAYNWRPQVYQIVDGTVDCSSGLHSQPNNNLQVTTMRS
jgi:hypothetical protein